MLYLNIILFLALKLFYNYDFLGTFIFGIFSIFSINMKEYNKFIIYYIMMILTNSGYLILLFNLYFILKYIIEAIKYNKINLNIFYIIAMLIILSFITLLHYNSLYDLLRLIIILTSFSIFFTVINDLNKKFVDIKIFVIYLILFSSEMANIYLLNMPERDSIFSGAENIPIIILLLLAIYLIFSKYIYFYYKIIVSILYLVMILNTQSRSILVVLLVLLILFLIKKISHANKYILLIGAISTFFVLNYINIDYLTVNNDSRILSIITQIGNGDLFSLEGLANIDIRGRVYKEAIDRIENSPYLGSGVVSPEVLKYAFGDEGMSSFHSSLFDILVTYGFLGFFIIILFLTHLFKQLINRNEEKRYFYLFIIVLFLTISLIQPYFFNIQVITLFYLLLYLGSIKSKSKHNGESL